MIKTWHAPQFGKKWRPSCNRKQSHSFRGERETMVRSIRALVAVGAAGLFLAACTVTPEPLTEKEAEQRVSEDRAALFAGQDPVAGAIDLPEAIARALKYNLDRKLKLMEEAVAGRDLDVQHYSLLPRVAAKAGYTMRSHPDSSLSRNLDTGVRSNRGTASYSEETEYPTADLEVAWNVLDFGVSYYRTQQQADQRLMVAERRRQVVHNIVSDVRRAYWRAVAAERLLGDLDPLIRRVKKALAESEALESERVSRPLDQLTYQRGLLETFRQLLELRRDMVAAKTELAVLMNLHPGAQFTLADKGTTPAERPDLPDLPLSMDKLETTALANRSELRGQQYQERIDAKEARVALLQMLPGLDLTAGLHASGDDLLIHDEWATGGLSVAWNLVDVFSGPSRRARAEAQRDLTRTRRLALSMAVISQVHVSALRYRTARQSADVAGRLASVETRIQAQMTAQSRARTDGRMGMIDARVRAALAKLRRDLSYAEAQSALGRVYASIGADPLPPTVPARDLATVEAAVAETLDRWSRGEVKPTTTIPLEPAEAAHMAPGQPGAPDGSGEPAAPQRAGEPAAPDGAGEPMTPETAETADTAGAPEPEPAKAETQPKAQAQAKTQEGPPTDDFLQWIAWHMTHGNS